MPLSPGSRADLTELDRFISDPFDEGAFDEESASLKGALKDFSKQVADESEDDVQVLSDQGDSNDGSDDGRKPRGRPQSQGPLKFNGLRPKSERTRAITHQNGFPEASRSIPNCIGPSDAPGFQNHN